MNCRGQTFSSTVWFSITVPEKMEVTVDTRGSDYDTVVVVYKDNKYLDCNDNIGSTFLDIDRDSEVVFAARPGHTYYVQVGAKTLTGMLQINQNRLSVPDNDNWANARPIEIFQTQPTAVASVQANEMTSCLTTFYGATVWYSMTVPYSMDVTVDTRGSDYDTVLAAYENAPPLGPNLLGCNDDIAQDVTQSQLTFAAEPGNTYYLQIGGVQPPTAGSVETGILHLNHDLPREYFCDGRQATIFGTAGPNTLEGTADPDVIVGLGGSDEIYGRGSDDVICGGGGNDRLYGGTGNDTVFGQYGADRLFGERDDDHLIGGEGNDLLKGKLGDDNLGGGDGNDVLRGHEGDDTLRGHGGDDRLYGADGTDALFGGAGSDLLRGGDGDDTCSGGEDVVC